MWVVGQSLMRESVQRLAKKKKSKDITPPPQKKHSSSQIQENKTFTLRALFQNLPIPVKKFCSCQTFRFESRLKWQESASTLTGENSSEVGEDHGNAVKESKALTLYKAECHFLFPDTQSWPSASQWDSIYCTLLSFTLLLNLFLPYECIPILHI